MAARGDGAAEAAREVLDDAWADAALAASCMPVLAWAAGLAGFSAALALADMALAAIALGWALAQPAAAGLGRALEHGAPLPPRVALPAALALLGAAVVAIAAGAAAAFPVAVSAHLAASAAAAALAAQGIAGIAACRKERGE